MPLRPGILNPALSAASASGACRWDGARPAAAGFPDLTEYARLGATVASSAGAEAALTPRAVGEERGVAWRKLGGLTFAYALAMSYSLFLAGATHGMPVIWTANAVVVAGLLVLRLRDGALLLALTSVLHVTLQLAAGDSLVPVLRYTLVDAVQEVATAALLARLNLRRRVRDMRNLLSLTLVSSVFTAATSLIINGLLSISAGGGFWDNWQAWVACNTLGMALVLPIAMVLMDRRHYRGFPARWPEIVGLTLLAGATSAILYRGDFMVEALVFGPAMLAVFRGGPPAAALAVMATLSAAVPTVLWRSGPQASETVSRLLETQFTQLVLYMVCMAAAFALARQARLQALLVRGQAQARAAEGRAQSANQAKSDFLATMSHEIRTPLNSILGFAALVAEDESLSPENRRRLDLVGRAGRSLADLVNDLLDFAKVEAGRLDLTLSAVRPADLLADAAAIVGPSADAKGLELDVSVEVRGAGDPQAAFALDEARLRQVLLNLLSNAVKFTAQGRVDARIVLGPEPGSLRFEVADTGIGIASDVQARLFQRFSQADSSISRRFGGTGLGLAISKSLVRQMGGDIGVQSELGRGSTFWISLTVSPAEGPTPRVATGGTVSEAESARVLLVDDHPMNRELGEALLTLAGCVVTTAEDGVQAVEAARQGRFDVVLMDVHMPGTDGLAATRAIRELPGAAGAVPILALTADVRADQVARCREAGMNDHVAKPIQRDQLLAAIARALAPGDVSDDRTLLRSAGSGRPGKG
jgi:signal transduction histidine kinase/CheY-like chemotaxis protein